MHCVRAEVVRWVDRGWPGWVEVHLREVDGTVALLVDKVPVFDGSDRLAAGVELPMKLEVPCQVLERVVGPSGERSVLIRLRFDIEDQNGRTVFNVDEGQLVRHS